MWLQPSFRLTIWCFDHDLNQLQAKQYVSLTFVTCGSSFTAVTTRGYVMESKSIQHWSNDQVINWVCNVYCSAWLVYHVIKEQHVHYSQWKWITVRPYQLFLRLKIVQVVSLLRTWSAFFSLQPIKLSLFSFLYHLYLIKLTAVGEKGVFHYTHVLHTSLTCTHIEDVISTMSIYLC